MPGARSAGWTGRSRWTCCGTPAAARSFGVFGRSKVNLADYDMAVKWVKTGYGYIHEFALPRIPEPEREKAEKFLAAAIPLVHRLDLANRQMLLPALADGQIGLVIDRRLASKQFVGNQPPTDKPMPMIEPALILGVSDPDLLKKAMSEYRAVVNGLIGAVREMDENARNPRGHPAPRAQRERCQRRQALQFYAARGLAARQATHAQHRGR